MPSQTARPTLAAIAITAGVSAPTVSKVLNGRFDVAEPTRIKVQELLVRHGYAPKRPESTYLIDLLLHDVRSSWADIIVRATVDAAAELGLGVVVSTARARQCRGDWLDRVLNRGTDGLVAVVEPLQPAEDARLAGYGVPVVLLDPLGEPTERVPSVGATNWHGGLTATEHLTRLGHRQIAVLGGPTTLSSTRARVEGYRAALTAAQIAPNADFIRYGNFTEQAGHNLTQALLDLPVPPTAIFCGNDEQAFGALKAARERGLRVPEDLSLVGFDDVPMASWLSPALTTVRQPLEAMAAEAVHLLTRMIAGSLVTGDTGTGRAHRVELGTELIVRDTTCPPGATQPLRPTQSY